MEKQLKDFCKTHKIEVKKGDDFNLMEFLCAIGSKALGLIPNMLTIERAAAKLKDSSKWGGCPNCGTTVTLDEKKCYACGSSLVEGGEDEEAEEESEEKPAKKGKKAKPAKDEDEDSDSDESDDEEEDEEEESDSDDDSDDEDGDDEEEDSEEDDDDDLADDDDASDDDEEEDSDEEDEEEEDEEEDSDSDDEDSDSDDEDADDESDDDSDDDDSDEDADDEDEDEEPAPKKDKHGRKPKASDPADKKKEREAQRKELEEKLPGFAKSPEKLDKIQYAKLVSIASLLGSKKPMKIGDADAIRKWCKKELAKKYSKKNKKK
jgi:hypothetical protein